MSRRKVSDEIRELDLEELILTTLTMLIGIENEDYFYYETDPNWWELRLHMRRN